jgi:hypothetical protein
MYAYVYEYEHVCSRYFFCALAVGRRYGIRREEIWYTAGGDMVYGGRRYGIRREEIWYTAYYDQQTGSMCMYV